jgi:transcriptional regulator
MYVPPKFREHRIAVLHDAIRAAGLGLLVTCGTDGLEATHVPMLLAPEPAPCGVLMGHIARANPQWRRVTQGADALAVFRGPDAYVSPSWYATKRQTGAVVPTWNYVSVHASGTLNFFDDRAALRGLIDRLTAAHEAAMPQPWSVDDAPAPYVAAMLDAIVGFTLTIARIEGAWKLSQNKSAEDKAGVAAGLASSGGETRAAVAALVADRS